MLGDAVADVGARVLREIEERTAVRELQPAVRLVEFALQADDLGLQRRPTREPSRWGLGLGRIGRPIPGRNGSNHSSSKINSLAGINKTGG
jgi:hypothetical protein